MIIMIRKQKKMKKEEAVVQKMRKMMIGKMKMDKEKVNLYKHNHPEQKY